MATSEKPGLDNEPVAVHRVHVYQTEPPHAGWQRDNLPPGIKKSLFDAWLLAFFAGFFGAHHFYLRRYTIGTVYLFTGGLFFVGWIIDWFRVPFLVKEANKEIEQELLPLCERPLPKKRLDDAYVLSFPLGFLGFHHFYLRRYGFGICYFFTLGLGFGWIIDWFRMPLLVKQANDKISKGTPYFLEKKSLFDAYMLAFPFGFMGLHRFYLKQPFWGLLYLCTFGLLGIGWLIDLVRMPWLVREVNQVIEYLGQQCLSRVATTSNGDGPPNASGPVTGPDGNRYYHLYGSTGHSAYPLPQPNQQPAMPPPPPYVQTVDDQEQATSPNLPPEKTALSQ